MGRSQEHGTNTGRRRIDAQRALSIAYTLEKLINKSSKASLNDDDV
jgi:hypothetical protein